MTNSLERAELLVNLFTETLRLQEWEISLAVLEDKAYKKATKKHFSYATDAITLIRNAKTADIYIRGDLPEDEFFTVLLHECVHLVTNSYDDFVRETLVHVDSKRLSKVFKNDAMWEMELMVTKITTILRPLLESKENEREVSFDD